MKKFKNISLKFDRHFSKGLVQQVLWLVGIMVIVYIGLIFLSFIGSLYNTNPSEITHWSDRFRDIFLVILDPGSASDSMSSIFTIICAILGLIIFSGMLISVISNALQRRVERYNSGTTNYKISNHIIILGFNESVPSLLREINKYHKGFILIMSEMPTIDIRNWLHAQLDKDDKIEHDIIERLIVINGVRNANDDIDRLYLNNNVQKIFIIGETNENAHDSISLECVKIIASKLNNINKVDCHVQIDSNTTFTMLQRVCMDFNNISFLPFNFDEIWAHKALATIPGDYYKPLDGNGITYNSNKHVHLVIVGMNSLSYSLAINAAHLLHFPNFIEGKYETYSKITFIDNNAISKSKIFRNKYNTLFNLARWREIYGHQCCDSNQHWVDPLADNDSDSPFKHLGPINFMDIQWEFIEGNIYDTHINTYLRNCVLNNSSITSFALCLDESTSNTSLCLSLPECILSQSNVILVRQNESDIMVNDILKHIPGYDNIRAFGMMNNCYREELLSDKYGKIINACYYEVDISNKQDVDRVWVNCQILNKWSSNYSASMLFTKFRSFGLDTTSKLTQHDIEKTFTDISNQEYIQRTEHNRWNTEKIILGFRPLYEDELKNWLSLDQSKKVEHKNKLKKLFRHVDICSNEHLKDIDPSSIDNDNVVNSKLWTIYNLILKDNTTN